MILFFEMIKFNYMTNYNENYQRKWWSLNFESDDNNEDEINLLNAMREFYLNK